MRARVAAEWSRRAQEQRREALESRLMALEDARGRRMRRCVDLGIVCMWCLYVSTLAYLRASLMCGGRFEAGGDAFDEEEEEEGEEAEVQRQEEPRVAPESLHAEKGPNGGSGGWFDVLRPSGSARGGIVAPAVAGLAGQQRQHVSSAAASGSAAGRSKEEVSEWLIQCGVRSIAEYGFPLPSPSIHQHI
jgi:hypothetical protein